MEHWWRERRRVANFLKFQAKWQKGQRGVVSDGGQGFEFKGKGKRKEDIRKISGCGGTPPWKNSVATPFRLLKCYEIVFLSHYLIQKSRIVNRMPVALLIVDLILEWDNCFPLDN